MKCGQAVENGKVQDAKTRLDGVEKQDVLGAPPQAVLVVATAEKTGVLTKSSQIQGKGIRCQVLRTAWLLVFARKVTREVDQRFRVLKRRSECLDRGRYQHFVLIGSEEVLDLVDKGGRNDDIAVDEDSETVIAV